MKKISQFLRNIRKDEKGFTLVELIIVIAILAVIAGIAAPNLIGYVNESREAADNTNAQLIANATIMAIANEEVAVSVDSSDAGVDTAIAKYLNGDFPNPKVDSSTNQGYFVEVDATGNVSVFYANSSGAKIASPQLYPQ